MHMVAGSVTLRSHSFFRDNSATGGGQTAGQTISLVSGTVTYVLPTISGFWMPATLCQVYRAACAPPYEVDQLSCQQASAQCALLPGEQPVVSLQSPTAGEVNITCRAPTTVQLCNWAESPHLIGKTTYGVPIGNFDLDLPLSCSPGTVGGGDTADQLTSTCGGLCPPGQLCSDPTTTAPSECPEGYACPLGSAVKLVRSRSEPAKPLLESRTQLIPACHSHANPVASRT